MYRHFIGAAVIAAGMVCVSHTSQAQGLGLLPRGENAQIGGALTERQARRACRQELRGSRESRRSLAIKMRNCVIEKQVGGR